MLNLTYDQVEKELKTRLTKHGVISDFDDSTQLRDVLTNRKKRIRDVANSGFKNQKRNRLSN